MALLKNDAEGFQKLKMKGSSWIFRPINAGA